MMQVRLLPEDFQAMFAGAEFAQIFARRARIDAILAACAKSLEEFPSLQHWLENDEYGSWRKRAEACWDHATKSPKNAAFTSEQIDSEIARHLKMLALEAEIRNIEGKAGNGG